MADGGWGIRLARAAEADFSEILRWTRKRFGTRQARVYERTLKRAIQALRDGPEAAGARPLEAAGAQFRMLHVARKGRKGRHFLVFRARTEGGQDMIEVLRILHEAMDPERHISGKDDA